MTDLLSGDVLASLVGVVDLRRGQAVHAIAGHRDQYRPVETSDGDAVVLAKHYQTLGVTELYIADLDAIIEGKVQLEVIDSVCRATNAGKVLIDIGWTGTETPQVCDAVEDLTDRHANLVWIVATESAVNVDAVAKISKLVTPARVFLGLDYRGGLIQTRGEIGETAWINAAIELGCRGVVALDLAAVGTGKGPSTMEICRRVKRLAPKLTLYSGGGIRSGHDVRELIEAGCDRCLVATALM